MKTHLSKWAGRLYIVLAVKIAIVAILLTALRVTFISVEKYKESTRQWLSKEYSIDVNFNDFSSGVDFSGVYLSLNDITVPASKDFPYTFSVKHLFVHIDLLASISELRLVFQSVSLVDSNVDLTLLPRKKESSSAEINQLSLSGVPDLFLRQLKTFSVKNLNIEYVNQVGQVQTIVVKELSWLNKGDVHQGVGKASLENTNGAHTLEFVIDLNSEDSHHLTGEIYAHADRINAVNFLKTKINPNAQLLKAGLSFESWLS
ncbi:MAG TPA: hypothetical protein EYH12_03020, partial [Psychromonas hadalis]|nr:hypothetical protein [Psychromonas hadalis]